MGIKSLPSTVNTLALHQAVEQQDVAQIERLRQEGHRPNQLDNARQSPVDLLARRRSIDQQLREHLHGALLSSMNPGAPQGYTKPEALHGSPWGFEILASGELKAGINDAKGGTQSLEGRIFFSDRTPEQPSDSVTRKNFRSKARVYARGEGMQSSNAASRAFQHRMTQAIDRHLTSGLPLTSSGNSLRLPVNDGETVDEAVARWLQSLLNVSRNSKLAAFRTTPFENSASLLKFPESITLHSANSSPQSYSGEALRSLLMEAGNRLRSQLEQGKTPLLALINKGNVVPMVFGFGKIEGLETHAISGTLSKNIKNYSYQNENHPLSGSAKGGKLKEIELRSLEDLATLSLASLAKGVPLPGQTLIRINPAARDKAAQNTRARYLDAQQLSRFQHRLTALLKDEGIRIENATLPELQQINEAVRGNDLAAWI